MQIDEITRVLTELSNEENAFKQKKYLRNQFEFFGVSSPRRKLAFRDFLKAEKRKVKLIGKLLNKFGINHNVNINIL